MHLRVTLFIEGDDQARHPEVAAASGPRRMTPTVIYRFIPPPTIFMNFGP